MSNFTFKQYEAILDQLCQLALPCYRVRDFVAAPPQGAFVMLRHDVEWGTQRATTMAEAEAKRGLQATYYFHGPHRPRVFVPSAMQAIQAMGHEIGYHYEVLDLCDGDFDKAAALFAEQLAAFRQAGLNVATVCAHGNPRKRKVGYRHNYDLFKEQLDHLRAEHDIIGEGYLSIDLNRYDYVSDVGIRFAKYGNGTDALIKKLAEGEMRQVYMLTHPDYWSRGRFRAFGLYATGVALRTLNLNKYLSAGRQLVGKRRRPVSSSR